MDSVRIGLLQKYSFPDEKTFLPVQSYARLFYALARAQVIL
jgi:hypothetical protein